MTDPTIQFGGRGTSDGLFRGVVTIAIAGIALGVAFNWLGLDSRPAWGLPWVGEDRLAALESLESHRAPLPDPEPSFGYEQIDDPMAIGLGAADADLPEIPALDRPVQIELDAVKRLYDAEAALIVDARGREEYLAGHITGAVNLIFDEVTSEPERMETLETGGRPIVVYCSGGTCEVSLDLAWELLAVGHSRVVVYVGGYDEWREAGYPVSLGGGGRSVKRTMSWLSHPGLVRGCQIVIGLLFAWASLAKLGDLQSFATQVHNFRMMPVAIENLVAVTLPWIELLASMALILDVQPRAGAAVILSLLTVFTAGVLVAMARGLDIECGCFGTSDVTRVGVGKVLQNVGMLALAWVALRRPTR